MAYYDQATLKDTHGRPIPQYFNKENNVYEPAEGSNGATNVIINGSTRRLPVDIQGFTVGEPIQTHIGTIIAPAAENIPSDWKDIGDFKELAISVYGDSTKFSMKVLWSHDGSTIHREDQVIPVATTKNLTGVHVKRGAKWFKIVPKNEDVAPKTFNTWVEPQ